MKLVLSFVKKLGLVGKILPALFKAVADGSFGPKPKAIYWFLAGKKTVIGATGWVIAEALAMYAGSGVCVSCADYLPYVRDFFAFLVVVGLADSAVRTEPPVPPKQ